MNSSKIVRTADLPLSIVVRVLESLNRGKIILVTYGDDITIVTDTNPRQFNFPEGWYFSNGVFTNKFHATRHYSEAKIVNSRGSTWMGTAGCLPIKANNQIKKILSFSLSSKRVFFCLYYYIFSKYFTQFSHFFVDLTTVSIL